MSCYSVSFLEEIEIKGKLRIKRRNLKFRSSRKPLDLMNKVAGFVAQHTDPDGLVISVPTIRPIPDPDQLPEI